MKENRLIIKINKPAKDVFSFVTNPTNAPKWIDSVVSEETNEWPPKVGTIYRDKDVSGESFEYIVTTFELNKVIVLSQKWGYHERLTLTSLDAHTTELDYYEWADNDNLPEVTTQARMEKLKRLVEAT